MTSKDIDRYTCMHSYVLKVREVKRILLGSYEEALCVVTGAVLFAPLWITT